MVRADTGVPSAEEAPGACRAPLPQWHIEVTGGGRIWYLIDDDKRTVWVVVAGTGHPKATD